MDLINQLFNFSPEQVTVFGQLFLAIILGAIIGVERRLAHKTAGMRTFSLVCMGAALFTIISVVSFEDFRNKPGFDPSRIASQIVVGIGFLGAGLIILKESKVKGLTTAAGLWVTAAIGMAVGYKLYAIAIFATVLTFLVFLLMWFIEFKIVDKIPFHYRGNGEEKDY